MKFAAFISIIVSVAVMFAACDQGPGAHEHDDLSADDHSHPHAPTDHSHDTTHMHPDAPGPLEVRPDAKPIRIDDGEEDENAIIGALPTGLSAATYFRGGKLPLKYAVSRIDNDFDDDGMRMPDDSNDEALGDEKMKSFDLKVDADTGVMTFTKREKPVAAQATFSADDAVYNVGDHFNLKVTDADGFTENVNIIVLRNRAPSKAGAGDIFTAAITAILVGTQDGIQLDTNNKEQTSTDACGAADKDRLNVFCYTKAQVEEAFNIDGDSGVMYTARSKNPANADAEILSDGRLKITGKMILLDKDAAEDVKVFLKATDSKGLASKEHEILVGVDPMPVIGALVTSVSVKASGNPTEGVIRGIGTTGADEFFISNKDEGNENETMTLHLVDANGQAADGMTTNEYFSAAIDANDLNITGNNVTRTPVALVILAEETGDAPNQWVKHTVMVTVIPNS
jgi:hypothetical protein